MNHAVKPKSLNIRYRILALCLCLCGCAELPTTDKDIDSGQVRQIVRGETTGDQIVAMFGTPYRKVFRPDLSLETWQYMYFNRVTGARKFLFVLVRGNVVLNVAYSGEPIGPMTEEQFARMQGWLPKANPEIEPNGQSHEPQNPSPAAGAEVTSMEEKLRRVAAPLGAGLLFKYMSRPGAQDNKFTSVKRSMYSTRGDQLIESSIDQVFDDKSALFREIVEKSVEDIVSGEFTVQDVAEKTAKQQLIDWLQTRYPQLANIFEALNFLDDVLERWQALKR